MVGAQAAAFVAGHRHCDACARRLWSKGRTSFQFRTPFGVTVELLRDVLPVGTTLNAETVRNHLQRVATRMDGSIKIRCARLTGERQGVRVPRNEGVTNHVSPRAVRRSSRGVRRSVGSGSCGRAVEHRKGTCPGCRGFRIGRRQHRWPRYGEWSASPAVSENPCTHESLSSGPGRPPPHLGLSAGVAKGRQNCRSRRRTGRRSQTRS